MLGILPTFSRLTYQTMVPMGEGNQIDECVVLVARIRFVELVNGPIHQSNTQNLELGAGTWLDSVLSFCYNDRGASATETEATCLLC